MFSLVIFTMVLCHALFLQCHALFRSAMLFYEPTFYALHFCKNFVKIGPKKKEVTLLIGNLKKQILQNLVTILFSQWLLIS